MNKKELTNIEKQSNDFADELYKKLIHDTKVAFKENKKFVVLASSYLSDGLTPEETIELLMVDGVTKDAANGYVQKVIDEQLNS